MAEIKLTAMQRHGLGGPETPGEIGAIIQMRPWPGGGKVPWLLLFVGNDTVEIWPADPVRIKQLGEKLVRIADELEGE